jgi:hypothetical protein
MRPLWRRRHTVNLISLIADLDDDGLSLILTLQQKSLWGKFTFGRLDGVMFFPNRLWTASDEKIKFTWRGHTNSGQISTSGGNWGWIQVSNPELDGPYPQPAFAFLQQRIVSWRWRNMGLVRL